MNSLYEDTDPATERALIAGLRRMSHRRKLERVQELNRAALQMAMVRLRQQYPHASESEQRHRLASLWIDRNLMIEAFGWDPDKHGR